MPKSDTGRNYLKNPLAPNLDTSGKYLHILRFLRQQYFYLYFTRQSPIFVEILNPLIIMKKLLFLLMLCLPLASYSFDFRFGIKMGAIISSVSNDDAVNPNNFNFPEPFLDNNSATFTAGLISQLDLWKGFGVDPELMFQTVSAKFNHHAIEEGLPYEDLFTVEEAKYNTYNLSLPVMLRYRFDIGNGFFAPKIFTGPVISLRMQNSNTATMKSPLMQFDWRAGIGMILNRKFELSASYNIGLNDYAQYKNTIDKPEIHNKVSYWTVALGYYL